MLGNIKCYRRKQSRLVVQCEGWGQRVATLKGQVRVTPLIGSYTGAKTQGSEGVSHADIWRKTIPGREDRQNRALECPGTQKEVAGAGVDEQGQEQEGKIQLMQVPAGHDRHYSSYPK